jgi:hypothetical protein
VFFFFSGSVFQRELQVFARARGGFRRAAAAGECYFFCFLLTRKGRTPTTNLIFEPTPLGGRFFLSLCVVDTRASFFSKLTRSFSLSLLDRHRSPYAETSKTGGVSDPGTPQSVFTSREGRNPFDIKKFFLLPRGRERRKSARNWGRFFSRSGSRRRLLFDLDRR